MYTLILFLIETNKNITVFKTKNGVEIPALVLSVIFLLDLIANMVVLGLRKILQKRKILLLEFCLQIVYWSLVVDDLFLTNEDN